MKWLKNLVLNRSGRVKIMWTITFILLVMTFVTGLGQPILTSTIDRKLEEFSDGQRNKSLYDSWEQHKRNLAKIQGYDYKDPREVKKESLLWSWKWGIGFIIFFFTSLIYTGAAGMGETFRFMKQRIESRQKNSGNGTGWKWIIIPAAVGATIYAEILLLRKGTNLFEKLAARFFAAARKIVKGVEP